jgi:ribose transport system substrate-binding protein
MTRATSAFRLGATAAIVAGAIGVAACGSDDNTGAVSGAPATSGASSGAASTAKAGDIRPFCPDKPTKAIFVKANGGEVWSATSIAEFMDEAKKCPNLQASAANVTGGQQAAVTAYNAAVAQGAKVIVTVGDFGPALLPTIRRAKKAGVAIVPFLAEVGGTKGVDYTDKMLWDGKLIMKNAAEWLAQNVKSGKMAFLGGPPGVSSSVALFKDLEAALASTAPDIKLVPGGTYTPTGFTAQGMRQAMAGLLAKYGKIDAVFTDYGAAYVGALQALQDANAPMPALVSIGDSNGISCAAKTHKLTWLAQDGSTLMVRAALRIALADLAGKQSPEPNPFPLRPFVDTAANPGEYKCDPSITPDADLSSSLPKEQLKELISK